MFLSFYDTESKEPFCLHTMSGQPPVQESGDKKPPPPTPPYHPERGVAACAATSGFAPAIVVQNAGCHSEKIARVLEDLREYDLEVNSSELIIRNVHEYLLIKAYREEQLENARNAAKEKLKASGPSNKA